MPTEGIIKQCSIVLTRGCNLRCNFCYVKRAGYVEDDRIDYDDLKSIVDFCCEAKVKYIFFTGGEPLTYSHDNRNRNKRCAAQRYGAVQNVD